MKQATLCFLIRKGEPDDVLLGLKKRGFGRGKYNGLGGKIQPGESARHAAAREIEEEAGINVRPESLVPSGRLTFVFPANADFDHDVMLFVAWTWQGDPRESDEMRPAWFPITGLPFHQMWRDDPHWLPLVLAGHSVEAEFVFADDNESVARAAVRCTA